MDTQVDTPFDWEALAEEISEMATPVTATSVMEFGIEKKWFFRLMDEKGVIDSPIFKTDWQFVPIESDSTTIPKEALERLEAVKARFPIKQVIIGHEIVEKPELDTPVKVEPKRETKPPDIPWKRIATVAGGLAVAGIVGAALVVTLAPLLIIAAAATGALADPCLVVVLDDPNETWIAIYEWLDEPA